MDWVKGHYDRVAVIAAAAFLFFTAVLVWRNAAQFSASFLALQAAPPPKPPKPPAKAIELETVAEKLHTPPQWTFSGRSGLFVPEKHFIDSNGLPATLQTTQIHPPVPNEWLEQFGLPIVDADVLTQDPDGDGFSNLDEWQGHTNPIDKNSHPDYVTKLKLKTFTEEPFRLVFSSSDETSGTVGINEIDMRQPTQFLRVGDHIAGTRFKIVKFTPKHELNPATGGEMDVSELQLENEETHEQLTLIKEKIAMSPESVATFSYSWPASQPPREFQVRKDQEFSLKPQEEIKYKLIDVQPTKAVIVNTGKPTEPIEIGLLAP
jgi:hypothetical protein